MDKYFLLTYTMNGKDGFRHSYHAWFETEKELREYSRAMKSHFRKFGNQMSGSGNHLCNYASLLA